MHSSLYARDDTSAVVKPPLSQAVGYVVVVGIGLVIALGMFQNRLLSPILTKERYDFRNSGPEENGRRG